MPSAEFVDCKSLSPGTRLDIETRNRHYCIECLGGSAIRISGHPDYCPTPVSGRVIDPLIACGGHLQFLLEDRRPVTTSRVVKVRLHQPGSPSTIH